MREPYSEGLAGHTGPEPCASIGEDTGEALGGVHTGQPLSCEIRWTRASTLLSEAEDNTAHDASREPCAGPAQSETLSMCGNSLHGNREIPEVPAVPFRAGRLEKANRHTSSMDTSGKSDGCVVPEKLSNKGITPAEMVEERQPTERNILQTAALRNQSRAGVSIGLQGVREAARKRPHVRFTALLRHVTVDLLRGIF